MERDSTSPTPPLPGHEPVGGDPWRPWYQPPAWLLIMALTGGITLGVWAGATWPGFGPDRPEGASGPTTASTTTTTTTVPTEETEPTTTAPTTTQPPTTTAAPTTTQPPETTEPPTSAPETTEPPETTVPEEEDAPEPEGEAPVTEETTAGNRIASGGSANPSGVASGVASPAP